MSLEPFLVGLWNVAIYKDNIRGHKKMAHTNSHTCAGIREFSRCFVRPRS